MDVLKDLIGAAFLILILSAAWTVSDKTTGAAVDKLPEVKPVQFYCE